MKSMGKVLQNHMAGENYIVIASDFSTNYPNILHHMSDVLEVNIVKCNSIIIYIININQVSSDQNLVIQDINEKSG